MTPWFGITGLVIVGLIAIWRRSAMAAICAAALAATVTLRLFPIDFIPAATAIWWLAGLIAMGRGYYLGGALYGASGLFYLTAYIGLGDARFAVLHIGSDALYIAGIVVALWQDGLFVGVAGIRRSLVGSIHNIGLYRARLGLPQQDNGRASEADK